MRDSHVATTVYGAVDSTRSDATHTLPPPIDDSNLLALEVQFDGLVTELLAALKASGELVICPDSRSLFQNNLQARVGAEPDYEARTKQVEAILSRLYPIEQAIMQTPARTIRGLGVKARHAAYVMSQYWEMPVDRIDWDAQAVRLLIEAVCNVAHVSLPICEADHDLELQ